MSFEVSQGQYFRAVLTSDDLTTAAPIVLQDIDGNTITLVAGQRPVIDHLTVNNGGSASVVSIFQDLDGGADADATELLYRVSCAANGGYPQDFCSPLICRKAPTTAANGRLQAVASAASAGSSIVVVGRILSA